MKKSLLFFLLLSLIGWFKKAEAQLTSACSISDIVVSNVRPVSSSGTTCTVTFDVSFTLDANNGNKYIYAASWLEADYPNYFNCTNGVPPNGAAKAPVAADLANAFLKLGLDNSGAAPVVLTTYLPDPSVSLNTVGSISTFTLANGDERITLRNVVTTIPVACGTPVVIITDIFGTNAANGNVIQCVDCGLRTSGGHLGVTGSGVCNSNQYTVTITNRTNTAITGTYNIYVDQNGDAIFAPASGGGTDNLIQSGTFSVAAGVGTTTTINVLLPAGSIGKDLFVELHINNTNSSRVDLVRAPECIPLPVTLQSFNARRNGNSNVIINWETATEINNRGFAIQRRAGNGAWETIAFVSTQAQGGNSNSQLTYSYTDVNNERGATQYRLQQVDFDGQKKYTDIRSVRGIGQKSNIIIYPNPSRDGIINILFDDANGSRSVFVSDMTGRILKQLKNITSSSVRIEKLQPGMYHIRIRNDQSGRQTTEKLVVGY